jgi:hypothetical protein
MSRRTHSAQEPARKRLALQPLPRKLARSPNLSDAIAARSGFVFRVRHPLTVRFDRFRTRAVLETVTRCVLPYDTFRSVNGTCDDGG